jgi:hypothetical protein
MPIKRKQLLGTWRGKTDDDATITITFTADDRFRWSTKGGPGYVRAVIVVAGDFTGKWRFREPDEIRWRPDFKDMPWAKWTGGGKIARAQQWFEELCGVEFGKGAYDEIWTVVSVDEDELELDWGPTFNKLE